MGIPYVTLPLMLTALRYAGGKARPGLNKWIASILPTFPRIYCEPFAGMLGILLNRAPAPIEIVNDLSGDVCNWWYHVAVKESKFINAVANLPWSRPLYLQSVQVLKTEWETDAEYLLERAVAYHIVIEQGTLHGEDTVRSSWSISLRGPQPNPERWRNKILALSERIRPVQFESTDAIPLIRRLGQHRDALIYCDPPYPSKTRRIYGHDVDQHDLVSELKECKSLAAISGYNDDWDELGWYASRLEVQGAAALQQMSNRQVETL